MLKEADDEKIRLENKQRALRKEREEKGVEFKPEFFELVEIINPFTNKKETWFQPKQGP